MNLLPVPSILELPIPLLVRQNHQHPRLDCGPGLLEGRCLLSLHRELFLIALHSPTIGQAMDIQTVL